jgi:hypothetical protein
VSFVVRIVLPGGVYEAVCACEGFEDLLFCAAFLDICETVWQGGCECCKS